jgi:hypothetical protein
MKFFKNLFKPDKNTEKIVRAFPAFLKNDVLSFLEKVSLKGEHEISEPFVVFVESEKLEIPHRIYFEEPNIKSLTETELLILNCLFTRHHNGFIRQKSLEQIVLSDEYWITPFIVQLLGEYVREILEVVEENLSNILLNNIVRFIAENPKFFETTKSRIISYWNSYYRNRSFDENYRNPIFDKETYVGFRILNKISLHAEIK